MKKALLLATLILLSATAGFAQCESLAFVTETLPDFVLGKASHVSIEITGADRPFRFEIVAGVLPDGVHMTPHGAIRGVPRQPVDNFISVKVTDDAGCTITKDFHVRVVSGP